MHQSSHIGSQWRHRFNKLSENFDTWCVSRPDAEPTMEGFKQLVSYITSNYKPMCREFVYTTIVHGMILPVTMVFTTALGSLAMWAVGKFHPSFRLATVVMDVPLFNLLAMALLVYRDLRKIDDLLLRFNVATVYMAAVYASHNALGFLKPTSFGRCVAKYFGFPYLFVAADWIIKTIRANWSDPAWRIMRKSTQAVYESVGWKKTPLFVRIK